MFEQFLHISVGREWTALHMVAGNIRLRQARAVRVLRGLLKNVLQGVTSGLSARRLYGFVLLPGRDAWQHQHQCFGGPLRWLFQQVLRLRFRKI